MIYSTVNKSKNLKHSLLIILVLFPIYLNAQLADTPWPMFQHDERHTGRSSYIGPDNPGVKWIYDTEKFPQDQGILVSPSIGLEDEIYICAGGTLFAILPNGSLKWKLHTAGDRIESAPAIAADGTVYISSGKWAHYDSIYAVSKQGVLKWATEMDSWSSQAIGSDGTIYCGTGWLTLSALNPDGATKWNSTNRDGAQESSPAIDQNGNIYVVAGTGTLLCHTSDGQIQWSLDIGANISTPPVIGGNGIIFLGSYNDSLYAINSNGSKRWAIHGSGNVYSIAIGSDGTIYAGLEGGYLYAVDPNSGTVEWQYQTHAAIKSWPVIDGNGTIYISASTFTTPRNSILYAINPDGSSKWSWDFPVGEEMYNKTSPVIDKNGVLYIATAWGKLYALADENQLFTATPDSFIDLHNGTVAWGDYDNDNDLDILLTGVDNVDNVYTKLYQNNANHFDDTNSPFPGIHNGSADWVDFDNDNDLDILLIGSTKENQYIAKLYRNNNAAFEEITTNLPGLVTSSSAWGDYDNDGDADVLIIGTTQDLTTVSKLYRNNGDADFVDVQAGLIGVADGAIAWGDYDNDGDLDLLLCGTPDRGSSWVSKIYRNNNGIFEDINAPIQDTFGGSAAWGDYDNDGDLDILLTGYVGWQQNYGSSKIYRNDNGNFLDTEAAITDVYQSCGVWGDYDNDGDLDILLTGTSTTITEKGTSIFRNDNGNFTLADTTLTQVSQSAAAWGDYDNDGDLDILIAGHVGGTSGNFIEATKVFKNNVTVSNSPPNSPTNLSCSISGDSVEFSWDKATDVQTPQDGLTYNLRIGTTADGNDILSALADGNTGFHKVAGMGNTNHNNKWMLQNLPDSTFYWSVQTTDHGFASSAFAPEVSFTLSEEKNPLSDSPWAMFRHDLQHTGRSPFTGSSRNDSKWTFQTNGAVLSSPAIGKDSTIYIGSSDHNLYALNPNGTLKWKFTAGNQILSSPAVAANEIIYVGCMNNNLYAIEPKFGNLKWAFTTSAPISSSPAFATDGTIYVGSMDNYLYAIDTSGTEKWKFATGGLIDNSSPAVAVDGTIYIGSDALYAINANGSEKWRYNTPNRLYSSPAIGADSTIYIGSEDGNLYAINADGSLKWSFHTQEKIRSSPAIGEDGTIFFGSDDDRFYAVDGDNGQLKWMVPFLTGDNICSSPAIGADSTIYFGSMDGYLYALNYDGALKWAFPTSQAVISSPIIGGDGAIYVGSGEINSSTGAIHAIGSAVVTITSPKAGDEWVQGNAYTIEGHLSTGLASVQVIFEFSTDPQGISWNTIQSYDLTSSNYSFEWTVPLLANHSFDHSRIRVTVISSEGPIGSATSDEFTIFYNQAPAITIQSPHLNEVLMRNSQFPVYCSVSDPDQDSVSVDFEYSSDFGVNWHPIQSFHWQPGNQSFNWTVPDLDISSDSCLIRATPTDDRGGIGAIQQSERFIIIGKNTPPFVELTTSLADSVWDAGTTQRIEYNVVDRDATVDTIRFEYSTNGGNSWNTIQTFTTTTTNQIAAAYFDWTLPAIAATYERCLLRITITDPGNLNFTDQSEVFTIYVHQPPAVVITTPTAGSIYDKNTTLQIAATVTDVDNDLDSLEVAYSIDGGQQWTPILKDQINNLSFDGATGVFSTNWTTPSLQQTSTQCRIRIIAKDQKNLSVSAQSGLFAIVSEKYPPVVSLSYPQAGSIWIVGSSYAIRGSVTDQDNSHVELKFEYSTDGGNNWNQIALYPNYDVSVSDIVENWTVPALTASSSNCHIRITATDADGLVTSAQSDAFNIILQSDVQLMQLLDQLNGKYAHYAGLKSWTDDDNAKPDDLPQSLDAVSDDIWMLRHPLSFGLNPTQIGYDLNEWYKGKGIIEWQHPTGVSHSLDYDGMDFITWLNGLGIPTDQIDKFGKNFFEKFGFNFGVQSYAYAPIDWNDNLNRAEIEMIVQAQGTLSFASVNADASGHVFYDSANDILKQTPIEQFTLGLAAINLKEYQYDFEKEFRSRLLIKKREPFLNTEIKFIDKELNFGKVSGAASFTGTAEPKVSLVAGQTRWLGGLGLAVKFAFEMGINASYTSPAGWDNFFEEAPTVTFTGKPQETPYLLAELIVPFEDGLNINSPSEPTTVYYKNTQSFSPTLRLKMPPIVLQFDAEAKMNPKSVSKTFKVKESRTFSYGLGTITVDVDVNKTFGSNPSPIHKKMEPKILNIFNGIDGETSGIFGSQIVTIKKASGSKALKSLLAETQDDNVLADIFVYDTGGNRSGYAGGQLEDGIPGGKMDGANQSLSLPSTVHQFSIQIVGNGTEQYDLIVNTPIRVIQPDGSLEMTYGSYHLSNVSTQAGDEDVFVFDTNILNDEVQKQINAGDSLANAITEVFKNLDFDEDGIADWDDQDLNISRPACAIAMTDVSGSAGDKIDLSAKLYSLSQSIAGEQVSFYENTSLIGNAATNANGIASIQYIIPQDKISGQYSITATFGGNSGYQPASTLAELTVKNKAPMIVLLQPVTGDTIDGQYQIQVQIKDGNLQSYTMLMDTTALIPTVSQTDTGVSLTCNLNTTEYFDGAHELFVTAIDHTGLVNSQFRGIYIDNDTQPQQPIGLIAGAADNAVQLMWEPNIEEDVVEYRVYRSTTIGSDYQKANHVVIPSSSTKYKDIYLYNGVQYFYVVTAVDRSGLESDFSAEIDVIPGTDSVSPTTEILVDPANPQQPGEVFVLLNPSEILFTAPNLKIKMPGEITPISVELDQYGKYWMGSFWIPSPLPSGTAVFHFSGRDAAGNIGTEITYGDSLILGSAQEEQVAWTCKVDSSIQWLDRWEDGFATGDLNNDGNADVVFGLKGGLVMAVNGKTGTKLWGYQLPDNPDFVNADIVDVDEDGILDVMAGSERVSTKAKIVALNTDGSLKWEITGDYQSVTDFVYGDVNGDGINNVVAPVGTYAGGGGQVVLLDGRDGNRIWTADADLGMGMPTAIDAVDVDGDSDMEIAVVNYSKRVYLIDGSTNSVLWSKGGIYHGRDVMIADVNDDGNKEVVAILGDVYCYDYQGNKIWSSSVPAEHVKACDPNHDGKTDLLVSTESHGKTSLLSGATGSVYWTRINEGIADVGDFDGNGIEELVLGTYKLMTPQPDSHYVAIVNNKNQVVWKYKLNEQPTALIAANIDMDSADEILVVIGSKLLALNFIKTDILKSEVKTLPLKFHLSQNYPNPFNPETTIDYHVPKSSFVTVKIYNIMGQIVKILVDKKHQPGKYSFVWDGLNAYDQKVTSGVYFIVMQAIGFRAVRKMLVLR